MAKKFKRSRKTAPSDPRVGTPPAEVGASAPDPPAIAKPSGSGKAAGKGKVKIRTKGAGRTPPKAVATGLPGLSRSLGKLVRRRQSLGALERLEMAVDEVRLGGRDSPRTRRLLAAGLPKMAQKVIEEAGEAAIEAVRGDTGALVNETADLFYNLVVLLRGAGIPVAAVWTEMDRRAVALGMAEKLPKAIDPEM